MNRSMTAIPGLRVVSRLLLWVAVVAIIFSVVIFIWLYCEFPLPEDPKSRVLYLDQYVDLIQLIVVGVVVTLLSVIIPMILPEVKDKFERYKESRLAYSRAKTATIYLPDKVAGVGREKAFQFVEDAHRELHLAETFIDMIIEKKYLKWFKSPYSWISYNYWQIIAVAEVLRKFDWNSTDDLNRLNKQLKKSVDVIHNHFGKSGEYCEGENWDLKDGTHSGDEDKLEKKIHRSLYGFS